MNKEDVMNSLDSASRAINNNTAEAHAAVEPKKEPLSVRFSKFVTAHNNLIVPKDGKMYLRAEAWQFLLSQVGLFPSCDCIAMLKETEKGEREFVGVKVEVSLTNKQGVVMARSMMVARCEEDWLKGKPDYAVYGMAQTRAISRAARNVYGWVAVQAGFEATPWDEMPK